MKHIYMAFLTLFPSLSVYAFRGVPFRSALTRRSFSAARLIQASASSTDGDDDTAATVHTVTWETPNNGDDSNNSVITFLAKDGELLRTAALRRDLASPHNGRANLVNCRGLGTCGTCAVEIRSANPDSHWLPSLPLNQVESLRLSVPPGHGANNAGRLRLVCQVPVHGDLVVTKCGGFWGQHVDQGIVKPSVPTQPFGQAEFLLDWRSPPPTTTTDDGDDEDDNAKNKL